MCKLTEGGYQLKSGKIIPFHNCRLELLSTDEFSELSESKASILDTLLIRDALHGLRTDMQTVINKIDSFCSTREEGCPANRDSIVELIEETISEQPKKIYNKSLRIAKDLTLIVTFVIQIVIMYKLFL